MKANHRFLQHTLVTIAAIPVGAIGATLCETVISFVTMLFGALTGATMGMPDFSSFFQFHLLLAAYSAIPVGATILPLTYLLFFRHIVLKQVLQILGWIMLGTIAIGIPGSILFHSSTSAIFGFFLGILYARRKAPPEQKPAWLKMVLGLTTILILAVVMLPFTMFMGVFWSMHEIRWLEKEMKNPRVYAPMATNLALYCQSISSLSLTDLVSSAYLPQPIPQLNAHAWGEFSSDHASIQFGGGFYHYGYALRLDPSTSDVYLNYWELYFQSEDSPEASLIHFALPASARMPLTIFDSNVLSEYSRRIAGDPANLDFHKGRIRFLLKYEPSRVREACLDSINDLPDEWWPRLTLALWDSGHGKFTDASKALVEFVEQKPSYSRYIYLTWFYQTVNQPDKAASAIEKAVQFPIVDLSDDEDNTECRGYTVGVSAFRSGKYGAVIKLCDVLLPVRVNGDYAKAGLNELRSAAEAGRNGKPETFQPDSGILFFDPYENMDLNALLGQSATSGEAAGS